MKEIVLGIEGMTCQGCINTVTLSIKKAITYGSINMELVPGKAGIICDEDEDYRKIIDEINHKTQYHASFVSERILEEFEEGFAP